MKRNFQLFIEAKIFLKQLEKKLFTLYMYVKSRHLIYLPLILVKTFSMAEKICEEVEDKASLMLGLNQNGHIIAANKIP